MRRNCHRSLQWAWAAMPCSIVMKLHGLVILESPESPDASHSPPPLTVESSLLSSGTPRRPSPTPDAHAFTMVSSSLTASSVLSPSQRAKSVSPPSVLSPKKQTKSVSPPPQSVVQVSSLRQSVVPLAAQEESTVPTSESKDSKSSNFACGSSGSSNTRSTAHGYTSS